MSVVVVTPPHPVVVLSEAKAHLRVGHCDDDGLISGLIRAAIGNLDGPAGWLGRCLGRQVLELRLPAWRRSDRCGWSNAIDLPYGPVSAVQSVTYADTAGADQVLDPAAYRLIGGPVLVPAYGLTWPSARFDAESIRIRYAAGYDVVPEPIRAAIKLIVGDLYENREAQVIGAGTMTQFANPAVEALLSPFRVWSL